MINRREAIQKAVILGASAALGSKLFAPSARAADGGAAFTVPPVGYAFDALEPQIDAQTMQIHHDKHHAAYVAALNKVVAANPSLAGRSAEDLVKSLGSVPESARTAVRNAGGGHVNHSFFWLQLKQNNGRGPAGELAKAIDVKFGNFAGFQTKFTTAATGQFGSGWAWLTLDPQAGLRVESTPNQDSPLTAGRIPILGIDVWEHAYYLKYQNRRPEYVAAFYKVIDWDVVSERYIKALKG